MITPKYDVFTIPVKQFNEGCHAYLRATHQGGAILWGRDVTVMGVVTHEKGLFDKAEMKTKAKRGGGLTVLAPRVSKYASFINDICHYIQDPTYQRPARSYKKKDKAPPAEEPKVEAKAEPTEEAKTETPFQGDPVNTSEAVQDSDDLHSVLCSLRNEQQLVQVLGWPVVTGNKSYIHDLELGRRLGFGRPRDVRKIIARYESEIGEDMRAIASRSGSPNWLLGERSALFVVAKSDTPKANAILKEVIQVYITSRLRTKAQPTTDNFRDVLLEVLPSILQVFREELAHMQPPMPPPAPPAPRGRPDAEHKRLLGAEYMLEDILTEQIRMKMINNNHIGIMQEGNSVGGSKLKYNALTSNRIRHFLKLGTARAAELWYRKDDEGWKIHVGAVPFLTDMTNWWMFQARTATVTGKGSSKRNGSGRSATDAFELDVEDLTARLAALGVSDISAAIAGIRLSMPRVQ